MDGLHSAAVPATQADEPNNTFRPSEWDPIPPLAILKNRAPPEDAAARIDVAKTLLVDASAQVDRGHNVIILEPRLSSTVVTKYDASAAGDGGSAAAAMQSPTVKPSRKRRYEAYEVSSLRMTVCVQNMWKAAPLLPSNRGGSCCMDLTYDQVVQLYHQFAEVLQVMHEPKVVRLEESKGK